MDNTELLARYVRQQKELGMPDPLVEQGAAFVRSLQRGPAPQPAKTTATPIPAARVSVPQAAPRAVPPISRLSRIAPLAKSAAPEQLGPGPDCESPLPEVLTFGQKRELFKELFVAQCFKCHLAKTRNKFVFGAGNVDAPLMIIGEAPGGEEDIQGLPFVGPAGKLLTEMLDAVSLDRKKDVFIANVLKCRPPGNRTPESAEIIACLPLLKRQIAILRPRLLLLLGRIAAHALLETSDSISKMRGKTHIFNGVPVLVTYHPAAILRNPEYRAPADEDMRKAVSMLKDLPKEGL